MGTPSASEQTQRPAFANAELDDESTTDSLPGVWQLRQSMDLGQERQNKFASMVVDPKGKVQIVRYDVAKMVKWSAFRTLFYHGTAFTMDSIFYINILLQMALQLVSFGVMMLALDGPSRQELDLQPMKALLKQINEFVPFMVGYFVAVSLQRWWDLRVKALGRVFDSFVNVSMIVACELSDEKWSDLHTQICKYGVASIELLWQATRNDAQLQTMQEKGLLTDQEVNGLARQSTWQRPMSMWAWIMRICLSSLDHNRSTAPLSNHVMMECIKAREGMALINAYLDTQLPFAYVHLVCFLVNLQNAVFATVSGMTCAQSWGKGDYEEALHQVFSCLLIGIVYQAIFGITYAIANPFGEAVLDFPVAAYKAYHAALVDAILKAQQPCPVVVQDGQLVRPRMHDDKTNVSPAPQAKQSGKPASQGLQAPQAMQAARARQPASPRNLLNL